MIVSKYYPMRFITMYTHTSKICNDIQPSVYPYAKRLLYTANHTMALDIYWSETHGILLSLVKTYTTYNWGWRCVS